MHNSNLVSYLMFLNEIFRFFFGRYVYINHTNLPYAAFKMKVSHVPSTVQETFCSSN